MSGVGGTKKHGLHFSLGPVYQFSTTTKAPVRVDNSGIIYYFGSAAKIKLSDKARMLDVVETYGRLKAKPTGSTMQRPPKDKPNLWKFTNNPPDNCGETIIRNVYNTILNYEDSYIKGGGVPDQSFAVRAVYKLNEFGVPTDEIVKYRVASTLRYHSPANGRMMFLGAKMPMKLNDTSIIQETIREIKKKSRSFPLAISTDYTNQAWVVEHSDQNGSRKFVVQNTLDGKLYIFPLGAELENGLIPEKYIQIVTPHYPSWMAPFVHVKDYLSANGHLPLNPIVSWSVNSTGKQFIGCVVARNENENYQLLNQVLKTNGAYPRGKVTGPSEQESIGIAKVFSKKVFGKDESEPLRVDRIGAVGFELNFTLTGVRLEDFTVSASKIYDRQQDKGSQVLVGIAFAQPILWEPINKKTIEVDNLIELYMELKVNEYQLKFHRALDGIYGGEFPQSGRWIFKTTSSTFTSMMGQASDFLSFNMHVLLDKKTNAPIEFSCYKHVLNAITVYTELENLDLGTLSFYRTTRARVPDTTIDVPRKTSGAWIGRLDYLNKYCAIHTQLYVMGRLIDTKMEGNPIALNVINSYIDGTYNLNPLAITQLFPLRANFNTFTTREDGFFSASLLGRGFIAPQWWGNVLHWPISYIFSEFLHKEVCGIYHNGEKHHYFDPGDKNANPLIPWSELNDVAEYHIDCHHFGCDSLLGKLSDVETYNTFYNLFWWNVMRFDSRNTDITTIFSLETDHIPCALVRNGGSGIYEYAWPIDSMLETANPNWDGVWEDMAWLAHKAYLLAKNMTLSVELPTTNGVGSWGDMWVPLPEGWACEDFFSGCDQYGRVRPSILDYNFPKIETTGLQYIFALCLKDYHGSDGQWSNSVDTFWMIDPGRDHLLTDHFVIRDYPWVWQFIITNYNRFIVHNIRNQIMVHPNGHYSVMHDYQHCPMDKEPEAVLCAYIIETSAYEDEESPVSDYRTFYNDIEPLPFSERKGFMFDRLSFWNEAVVTTHVEMHNEAFKQTEVVKDYHPKSEQLYAEYTSDNYPTPVVVYGGNRYPCHYFHNPFMRSIVYGQAREAYKAKIPLAYPRIAPVWGG